MLGPPERAIAWRAVICGLRATGSDRSNLAVFNPAAWHDEATGEIRLLYRTAESGPEYKCWFGLARSRKQAWRALSTRLAESR